MATTESSGGAPGAKALTPDEAASREALERRDASAGEVRLTLDDLASIAAKVATAAVLAALKEHAGDSSNRSRRSSGSQAGQSAARSDVREDDESDEEYDSHLQSERIQSLPQLIQTERSRLILLDTLLAALDATFDEHHEMHLGSYRLSSADPAMIVVMLRKMLGRIINRLDPVYVDPLIEALQKPTHSEGMSEPQT